LMEHNLITREELIRKFNPDIDEAELAMKMEELDKEEKPQEETIFKGLNRLGSIGT
jgi:hypothetical protein